MQADNSSKILTALIAERDALRGFVSLLEQEQNALVENDTDKLLQLAEQKSASASALTELVETRHHLLQQTLPKLNAAAIQIWMQTSNKAAWPVWQNIRIFAERARQLNQSSGELIHLKLRHNQQALTVLDNASQKSNVYGSDGQPNFTPGSGRPLASA